MNAVMTSEALGQTDEECQQLSMNPSVHKDSHCFVVNLVPLHPEVEELGEFLRDDLVYHYLKYSSPACVDPNEPVGASGVRDSH
jgi:hypothetical protein